MKVLFTETLDYNNFKIAEVESLEEAFKLARDKEFYKTWLPNYTEEYFVDRFVITFYNKITNNYCYKDKDVDVEIELYNDWRE